MSNGETSSGPSRTGGCNCGAIRWELSEAPLGAGYCHCKRCQRRTGTAFSISVLPVPGSVKLLSGEDQLRGWNAGDGWTKQFCGECGSHVKTSNPEEEGAEALRIGGFDGDPQVEILFHQYTDYAPAWAPVADDGLPRYPERVDYTDLGPQSGGSPD